MTYLPSHDDKGYVRRVTFVESVGVSDVNAPSRSPLSHFADLLFLQLEQVQLEVRPLATVKFYIPSQAVELPLK
jgi:hypothetical protein